MRITVNGSVIEANLQCSRISSIFVCLVLRRVRRGNVIYFIEVQERLSSFIWQDLRKRSVVEVVYIMDQE